MGVEPNIIPFPRGKALMKKATLEKELSRLREELLPFYEDDEDALDDFIEHSKQGDKGAFGLMRAIGKCHGEIGLYRLLNLTYGDEDPE